MANARINVPKQCFSHSSLSVCPTNKDILITDLLSATGQTHKQEGRVAYLSVMLTLIIWLVVYKVSIRCLAVILLIA